jgi:hypothetical protein
MAHQRRQLAGLGVADAKIAATSSPNWGVPKIRALSETTYFVGLKTCRDARRVTGWITCAAQR